MQVGLCSGLVLAFWQPLWRSTSSRIAGAAFPSRPKPREHTAPGVHTTLLRESFRVSHESCLSPLGCHTNSILPVWFGCKSSLVM